MSSAPKPDSTWHKHFHAFDIDNYYKVLIPRNRIYLLPTPISFFLGYRKPDAKKQPQLANPFIWLSAFFGGFIGIAVISAVYHALPRLSGQQVPIIVASFGAAAILEYNTIESPLSQPRNLIVGHLLSALIGVAITKGFEHLPPDRFDDLRWLAGAISVGTASFVMGMTKTIHPPAGATALLASTSPEITVLGWWLLPLVLLASVLMAGTALLVNNLTRKWPLYWWTPADVSRKRDETFENVKDVEKNEMGTDQTRRKDSDTESEAESLSKVKSRHIEGGNTGNQETETEHETKEHQITITAAKVTLPDWLDLNDYERELLNVIRSKVAERSSP